MRIILDAMGGDNAPTEIVRGALSAIEEFGVDITLVGRGEDILSVLEQDGVSSLPSGMEVVHASQVISMEDNPSAAMREKRDSSIVVGMNLLADGGGDAFVSAGSTGALLSAATLRVKRIAGIRRAALATVIPTKKGGALLLDVGANAECTPEFLLQFAYMGSIYAVKVLGLENARVGLLNIGTEESKGGPLQKEAYPLLQEANSEGHVNFIGNIEGRDVMFGHADVVVTDGFSGNILLKTLEGAGLFFIDLFKGILTKNLKTKLAGAAIRSDMRAFKKLLDYAETGGAPLLGLNKPVIKAHGSSNARAIRGAINQAITFAKGGVPEDIASNIAFMKVGDTPPEGAAK